MNIDAAFPSTYLKAADLQGRNVTVVMDRIVMEDVGDDNKPVLYFQGKERGLVLNKTNSNNIKLVYGPETDNWRGQSLELFPTMVDFQGKSVEAIRVRPPRQNGQQRQAPHPSAPPEYTRPGHEELSDEVPF